MKLNHLLEELHADETKVIRLKAKHLAAKDQIKIAQSMQMYAQTQLDNARSNCQRKIRTFKLLDLILAEFEFEVKQQAEVKEKTLAKAKKRQSKGKGKTIQQTMDDVLDCLKALPEAQRQAVIKAMEDKNKTEEAEK